MNEDWLRDAMVQRISGVEGNLICCKMETDNVVAESGYSQGDGDLAQSGEEHRDIRLMSLNLQADFGDMCDSSRRR